VQIRDFHEYFGRSGQVVNNYREGPVLESPNRVESEYIETPTSQGV